MESSDRANDTDDLLWQVEVAKARGCSTSKAMNFINLSKEASAYGNTKLSNGLKTRASAALFNDHLSSIMDEVQKDSGKELLAKAETLMRRSRETFSKGDIRGAYRIMDELLRKEEEPQKPKEAVDEERANMYSDALGGLQKVWLKMKQEEGKGKDTASAKGLLKEAKRCLATGDYERVLALCEDIMMEIQTPQERLTEETESNIEEIAKNLRALFPDDPRSPKERFFKRQIEELLERSRGELGSGAIIDSINSSRKAKEIMSRLEQETIKGEIPKQIIELRASLDELRKLNVDISYEDYLLKQVESTFWNGNFIEARKTANKLLNILNNARVQYRLHELNTSLGELHGLLKEKVGKEGYLEAREYLDKAKVMMEQKAFDMAEDFLSKASSVLSR